MLDSLVRVSRRVNENHLVKIANLRKPGEISTDESKEHFFEVQKLTKAGKQRQKIGCLYLDRGRCMERRARGPEGTQPLKKLLQRTQSILTSKEAMARKQKGRKEKQGRAQANKPTKNNR